MGICFEFFEVSFNWLTGCRHPQSAPRLTGEPDSLSAIAPDRSSIQIALIRELHIAS